MKKLSENKRICKETENISFTFGEKIENNPFIASENSQEIQYNEKDEEEKKDSSKTTDSLFMKPNDNNIKLANSIEFSKNSEKTLTIKTENLSHQPTLSEKINTEVFFKLKIKIILFFNKGSIIFTSKHKNQNKMSIFHPNYSTDVVIFNYLTIIQKFFIL